MSSAIIWLRRDLRLHDNPALLHALQKHQHVIPVYIHAPEEQTPWAPGAASSWWLQNSLQALGDSLQQHGSRLILRHQASLVALQEIIAQTGATAVYWNRLYEPGIIARDSSIKKVLRETGITTTSFNSALLWEPWTIKTANNDPYKVFTPFWKNCIQHPVATPLPAPGTLQPPPIWPDSVALQDLALMPRIHWYQGLQDNWSPGETAALQLLQSFCDSLLDDYAEQRNIPAQPGTSRLSPYLHFGELSPRQIWQAVNNQSTADALYYKASLAYLRELGWREFAHQVLFHWPHTTDQPMQERFQYYPWREDCRENYHELLQAWQQGRTGYPLVDAGMRELWHTGWMHNRVRMVVASFLTKNCRIPWQQGARWFWDTLVDADLANNSMGWQWTAGCGTDAAPYFRIFNPLRQSDQFDAQGDYIKRWIPELEHDYPAPILDLKESRQQALAGFEQIKAIC